ncbi:hypothetical protein FB446DRAFT_100439 [Lentinula raphanica]|nr:hypothetical protein FB446DRAFT_100439 [Lentinula raphanica]
MRFTIVLLLGLVSATYALPNPGLRHFQPRSDMEADAHPAVGNHTSGLMPRADSAGTQPYFKRTPVVRYHILASPDLTGGMMNARQDYAMLLGHWSFCVISRIFLPRTFTQSLDLESPRLRLPMHEPNHWYYEIMNEHMAVVIDKATAQLVGWMPAAEASNLHDENLVVVKTPVIGSISVTGTIDSLEVWGAFCNYNREAIAGTSFRIPESEDPAQLGQDREIMAEFMSIHRGSSGQTHS